MVALYSNVTNNTLSFDSAARQVHPMTDRGKID